MKSGVFDKKAFIQSVRDNLKNLYRKTLEEADQQEIFQAVSFAVKDVINDRWLATQQVFDKEDPKIVYYMSMEFQNVFGYWPDALRARGVGIIPEDRYRQGVCLPVAVSQNLVAGYHGREPFSKGFRMNYKAVQENYTRLVQEYDIRLSNQDPPVGALSGGNAQKVIVAREFSQDPKLLYASQPTRGVESL